MQDMAKLVNDDEVSMLDTAEELLQTSGGDESMDDDSDLEQEANDLGDTADAADSAEAGLDAMDETMAEHPELDTESLGQKEAMEVVEQDEDGAKTKTSHAIGLLAQDNASKQAMAFVSKEDQREEAAIQRAQKHEKQQEEEAKKQMYQEMKKMNDEVTGDEQMLEDTRQGKKSKKKKAEKH